MVHYLEKNTSVFFFIYKNVLTKQYECGTIGLQVERRKPMENMIKTSMRIPKELVDEMKKIAKTRTSSYAQLVREAIIDFIKKNKEN